MAEATPLIEVIDKLVTVPFDQILNSDMIREQVMTHGESTLLHLPSAFKKPIAAWDTRLTGEPGQLDVCRQMLGLKPMAEAYVLDPAMNPDNRMPTAMLGPTERLNPLAFVNVPLLNHIIGPKTWQNCGYIVDSVGDFRGPTSNYQGMPMMERPDMTALRYREGHSEQPCQHFEGTQRCTERAAICCVACRIDHGLSRSRSLSCNLHSIMECENCLQGPFCLRCAHPARHSCVTGHRDFARQAFSDQICS